jgi:xylulokinase
MHILAVEVGAGFVHSAVLDVAAPAPDAVARVAYDIDVPMPDAAEVPAARLWDAVAAAARQAVRHADVAGRPGRDVAGVGLTTVAPALVLLGADDRPLAPVWLPADRRARPAARQVQAHVGDEFLQAIGCRPLPGHISALAWRQQLGVEPYLCQHARSYLHLGGWLTFHLTGTKAFDPANASLSGLFHTTGDRQWSPRWREYFEVDADWLPPVLDGAATVGNLRAAIANELGVPAGVPVKLGTIDRCGMMLAADMRPGDLLQIEGDGQLLATMSDKPTPSPYRLTHLLGVGPGYVRVAHNPLGAAALRWLHALCFRELSAEEFAGTVLPQARARKTRVTLDPPFLSAESLEIEAHRAAFRGLQLATDRLDLLAALLLALEHRHSEAMENLAMAHEWGRVVVTSDGGDPTLSPAGPWQREPQRLVHGPLRGAARLFEPRQ